MWKLVVKRSFFRRSQAMVEKPSGPSVATWIASGWKALMRLMARQGSHATRISG